MITQTKGFVKEVNQKLKYDGEEKTDGREEKISRDGDYRGFLRVRRNKIFFCAVCAVHNRTCRIDGFRQSDGETRNQKQKGKGKAFRRLFRADLFRFDCACRAFRKAPVSADKRTLRKLAARRRKGHRAYKKAPSRAGIHIRKAVSGLFGRRRRGAFVCYKKPDGNFGNRVGDWSDVVDLDYNNKDLWDYQIETLKM